MTNYTVRVSRQATKKIKKLDPTTAKRIAGKISDLQYGHPSGAKKLKDKNPSEWRVRVGNYRVTYEVDDDNKEIFVKAVDHRKDIYRP